MTETKKGGRKPAAGTKGYQAAHRRHIWSKARAAQAKWDRLRSSCGLRVHMDEARAMLTANSREIIAQWGAETLPAALQGDGGAAAIARLEVAIDTLAWALCGQPEAREAKAPAPRPADRKEWSYETSLREAGAVRLNAQASISEIEGLIATGEVVTLEEFGASYTKVCDALKSRMDIVPSRFGILLGEKSAHELTGLVVAELLEVLD